MKMRHFAQFLLLSLIEIPFFASGFPSPLIELSHTFDENTPTFSTLTRYSSKVAFSGTEPYGYWIAGNDYCSSEHAGTHMDAPAHFFKNGKTVDLIPFESLYRIPGIKVDVTEKAKLDSNYAVTAEDMEDWVATYGELPDGVVVLFETGWGLKVDDLDEYLGIDEMGNHNFPAIGKSGAEWLVSYGNRTDQTRGVLGAGVDSVSLDIGARIFHDAHRTILGNGLFGLENLKNVHMLPARNFTLTMLPMKIGKGTGGPTRIIAELDGVPFMDTETFMEKKINISYD